MSKYTKEILEPIVQQSFSVAEVARRLGIKSRSGSLWKHIKRKIEEHQLDTSHFKGLKANSGKAHKGGCQKKSPDEILVFLPGSGRIMTYQLKRALLEIGRKYCCEICGQLPTWKGKDLVLEIDHINGNGLDNREHNVRFLCPNCHSQTPNYGTRKRSKKQYKCTDCSKSISRRAKRCKSCATKKSKTMRREPAGDGTTSTR